MRTVSGVLFAALLLVGTSSSRAIAAQTKIPQEVIQTVINECARNNGLAWATPGSASQLCPCFIQNILEMPLRDSQRILLMGFYGGAEALRPYEPERMLSELRAEALDYMGRVQRGCHL